MLNPRDAELIDANAASSQNSICFGMRSHRIQYSILLLPKFQFDTENNSGKVKEKTSYHAQERFPVPHITCVILDVVLQRSWSVCHQDGHLIPVLERQIPGLTASTG